MTDLPAAHSMDTDWFAVDKHGHVALFQSEEEGCVPERYLQMFGREGEGEGRVPNLWDNPDREVPPLELEDIVVVETDSALRRLAGERTGWGDAIFSIRLLLAADAPGQALAEILGMDIPADGRDGPLLWAAARRAGAYRIPIRGACAVFLKEVDRRKLAQVLERGLARVCWGCSPEDPGPLGPLHSDHSKLFERAISFGPSWKLYIRDPLPESPLLVDELPAEYRANALTVRSAAADFLQCPKFQPRDHWPCHPPAAYWRAADQPVVRRFRRGRTFPVGDAEFPLVPIGANSFATSWELEWIRRDNEKTDLIERFPEDSDSARAATSPCWLATDGDGRVACFGTRGLGLVPCSAESLSLAEAVERLTEEDFRERRPILNGFVAPSARGLNCLLLFESPEMLDKFMQDPIGAGWLPLWTGRGPAVLWSEDEPRTARWTANHYGRIQECGIIPDPRNAPFSDMHLSPFERILPHLGVYYYRVRADGGFASLYERCVVSSRPISVDQLPAALKPQALSTRFERANFASDLVLQPAEHAPCRDGDDVYLSSDRSKLICAPGRERCFDLEFWKAKFGHLFEIVGPASPP